MASPARARHYPPKAVAFSPDCAWVAVFWVYDFKDPILGVYDAHTGQIHCSAIGNYSHGTTRTRALLQWSPTSGHLLFSTKGTYSNLAVDLGACMALTIRPHVISEYPDQAQQDAVWLSSERFVVRGVGQEDAPHYPHLIQPHDEKCFAVLANGTIISQWQPRSGKDSPKEASWGWVREHPLEPLWSRGLPGFVPPHDPVLAYISRNMGVKLDPNHDLRDKPCDPDDRTEMSTCGRALVKLPVDLRSITEVHMDVSCRLAGRPSHFAWDPALQKMTRRDPTFMAAHVHAPLAWHPRAASLPLYATVGRSGRVLLVNAKETTSQASWSGNTLENVQRRSFGAFGPLGCPHWGFLAWSPDGTMVFCARI
ncbi:hypothetical protein WJX84_006106 [Apatococcus fuscideae]|uniref:Uncharacterized protein n=1 Tax=Apatococcus fuscideae TaxID=2026836 RepID=A0AAW1SVC9_9CHLO